MANLLWICVMAFGWLICTSSALQCLKCNDCENEPSKSSSCILGMNVCAKMELGGKVRKFCAPDFVCNLESADQTAFNLLKTFKNLFNDKDIEQLTGKDDHGKKKTVHCCDSDFCNGSTEKRTSLGLLLLLPFILHLIGH